MKINQEGKKLKVVLKINEIEPSKGEKNAWKSRVISFERSTKMSKL